MLQSGAEQQGQLPLRDLPALLQKYNEMYSQLTSAVNSVASCHTMQALFGVGQSWLMRVMSLPGVPTVYHGLVLAFPCFAMHLTHAKC